MNYEWIEELERIHIEKNHLTCRKMDGAGEHHAKTDIERQTHFSHIQNIDQMTLKYGKHYLGGGGGAQENIMWDK